jgi:hypothetical protein
MVTRDPDELAMSTSVLGASENIVITSSGFGVWCLTILLFCVRRKSRWIAARNFRLVLVQSVSSVVTCIFLALQYVYPGRPCFLECK